jgi:S-methylmethionine-dependent homocysteine/selenocysteine methylase
VEIPRFFHEGFELPEFAAFVLLDSDEGRQALRRYFRAYADVARDQGIGCILESMTYRASEDWGAKLGLSPAQVADRNRKGIALLEDIRSEYEDEIPHVVISGCMGPRYDGYNAEDRMTAAQSAAYHRPQIATFRETAADMVAAYTLPYVAEGAGVAMAAREEGMPAVISFTVETDGRLPSGETIRDAVEQIDELTDSAPAYYMINCAHPTHFADALGDGPWTDRVRAVRANASAKSHAELDESSELDEGDPVDLGRQYVALAKQLRRLTVVGGCCGTDHRHVAEICSALKASA